MSAIFKLRIGTAADLLAQDPEVASNEWVVESDTGRTKLGPGTFSALAYSTFLWFLVGGSAPPSGPAGGDLMGTYPNPALYSIQGEVFNPEPSGFSGLLLHDVGGSYEVKQFLTVPDGYILSVNSGEPLGLEWIAPVTSATPVGPAGGDLTGTYPNPGVVQSTDTVAGKIELATFAEVITGTDNTRAVTPATLLNALNLGAVFGFGNNKVIITNSSGQLKGGTASTGLTLTDPNLKVNLSTGIAGGQSAIGGTAASENLTLSSTSNATKGKLLFGSSAYDEVNNRLGIGFASPVNALQIDKGNATAAYLQFTAGTTTGQTTTDGFHIGITSAGAGEIRQYENLDINIYNGNVLKGRFGYVANIALYENRNAGSGYGTSLSSGSTGTGFAINRNAATGTIYDSSHFAYQFTQQGNGLEVQRYTGAGAGAGYGFVIDEQATWPRIGLNILAPTAHLHQQAGNGLATTHKFTAGTTGGATATDGFDVGIDSTGQAVIRQYENLGIQVYTNNTVRATWLAGGSLSFSAGSAAANSAPMKLAEGALMTTPERGAIEANSDKLYFTIVTGTQRCVVALIDPVGGLSAGGYIPYTVTNGRLSQEGTFFFDAANQTLNAKHILLAAGGGVIAPLKFTTDALLGTPENGAVEYDDVQLYWTDSVPERWNLVPGLGIEEPTVDGSFDPATMEFWGVDSKKMLCTPVKWIKTKIEGVYYMMPLYTYVAP